MSQNQELDKIKLRIKALTEKTVDRGCSEHEANAAMDKVGELLQQYGLSMSDIDIREEKFVTREIKTGKRKRVLNGYTQGLGRLCSVKIWTSRYYETVTTKTYSAYERRMVTKTETVALVNYMVFGHESDCMLFEYLYNTIEAALKTELATFARTYKAGARGDKKVALNNFSDGFRGRINSRCNRLKEEIEYSLKHARSTGTALILLKDELVEEAYKDATAGMGLRVTKYYHTKKSDYAAHAAGAIAGEKVNLQRPIDNGFGANKLLLK